eukprot:6183458-Pleurochrysis_carterae.AAC.1
MRAHARAPVSLTFHLGATRKLLDLEIASSAAGSTRHCIAALTYVLLPLPSHSGGTFLEVKACNSVLLLWTMCSLTALSRCANLSWHNGSARLCSWPSDPLSRPDGYALPSGNASSLRTRSSEIGTQRLKRHRVKSLSRALTYPRVGHEFLEVRKSRSKQD